MHEFVERKERDIIKNIIRDLKLVRIFDTDTHLFKFLIELIHSFFYTHSGPPAIFQIISLLSYIIPHRFEYFYKRHPTGFLEIERMYFTFAIR